MHRPPVIRAFDPQMKIFVISLTSSHARRDSAAVQLRRFSLEFEFFPAISGKSALENCFDGYDEERFLRNTGRTACAGEIGCYASHLAVWRRCIEMDEPVVIMEDDFRLLEEFPESLRQLGRNIDRYGYIRLQTESRARKHREKKCGKFVLWRYTKVPHGAMCYGISPSVAAAFVEQSNILTAPIDVQVKKFWDHGQPMYGLTPYVVTESDLSWNTSIKGRQKQKKPLRMQLLRMVTKCDWYCRRLHFNLSQRYLSRSRSVHAGMKTERRLG